MGLPCLSGISALGVRCAAPEVKEARQPAGEASTITAEVNRLVALQSPAQNGTALQACYIENRYLEDRIRRKRREGEEKLTVSEADGNGNEILNVLIFVFTLFFSGCISQGF